MSNSSISFPVSKGREPESPIDIEKLNQTIDYIRPAVQADGGDLKLSKVENGVVNIEMLGACQGCPLSIATNGLFKKKFREFERLMQSRATKRLKTYYLQ